MSNHYSSIPFHPCMHPLAHKSRARIHLPVAKNCNITCQFCARHSATCQYRLPGASGKVFTPEEALVHLEKMRRVYGEDAIVGISGPGEPLMNPETFETLKSVMRIYPSHPICLCTNGLLLEKKLPELLQLGISTLSISMTGIEPDIVKFLQSSIKSENYTAIGRAAAKKLIEAQLTGLRLASAAGIFIKINAIVAKGVNDSHMTALSAAIKQAGAKIMNIVPVISPDAKHVFKSPTGNELEKLRDECEAIIPQFRLCKQCQSDASGIPGNHIRRERLS